MALDSFYCLSNAVLLIILFIYSTTYISNKSYKNYFFKKNIRNNLEKIYKMYSYQDSLHN